MYWLNYVSEECDSSPNIVVRLGSTTGVYFWKNDIQKNKFLLNARMQVCVCVCVCVSIYLYLYIYLSSFPKNFFF